MAHLGQSRSLGGGFEPYDRLVNLRLYRADPAPGSGGWCAVRGEVSFDLRGPVLRFSAPLSVVTDRTDLDVRPYMLETYEFGDWTGVHIVGYTVIRR